MRKRDTRGMQLLALFCLVTTVFALCFSQHAREMVTGLTGAPALRHHLLGRKLLKSTFTAARSARFEDYDGSENTAVQMRDDFWLATGFVEYDAQAARRRARWSCLFDAKSRDVRASEVGPGLHPTPEFLRELDAIRTPRSRGVPSTARSIQDAWGWKEP